MQNNYIRSCLSIYLSIDSSIRQTFVIDYRFDKTTER